MKQCSRRGCERDVKISYSLPGGTQRWCCPDHYDAMVKHYLEYAEMGEKFPTTN